jgi:hypothetical protein
MIDKVVVVDDDTGADIIKELNYFLPQYDVNTTVEYNEECRDGTFKTKTGMIVGINMEVLYDAKLKSYVSEVFYRTDDGALVDQCEITSYVVEVD